MIYLDDKDKYPDLGDPCPLECIGRLIEKHYGEGCSCHLNPPCSYCVDTTLICDTCGWEPEDVNSV